MAELRMTECERWSGYVRPDGYGVLRVGDDPVPRYAHRHVWERAHGPIPEGFEVHHVCGHEWCVRLDHLTLLSRHDHASLHFAQPRRPRASCRNGHPMTPENAGRRSDGFRYCRACARVRWRRENRRRTGAGR